IIVVDNASTDRTIEIARGHTPHVSQRPFDGYGPQKQAAVDRACGEWILSIDADERVTPELASEIRGALSGSPSQTGFEIPFEIRFMGGALRFGGLGDERHLRLFRKSAGRFSGDIHEEIGVEGSVGRLRGRMIHIPYHDIDEYLDKMSFYTTLAAKKRRDQGIRFTPLHCLLPAWEFFVRSVVRLGALDGIPGLVWAALSSFHTGIKYLKLRELERK
ncbi:MAG: glycosyltransferase family 2 protein, partial [Elusimicrobia bacterium]|nr:glycosyltransferase family 2 protein [Elusimicrobiota bacterium]